MKKVYLFLSIVGLIVPYYFFVPFIVEHGFNLTLFFQEIFANQNSSFAAADLFISSVILWLFIYRESQKYQIKTWWIAIIANLTVGISLALPLFLYWRESAIANKQIVKPEN